MNKARDGNNNITHRRSIGSRHCLVLLPSLCLQGRCIYSAPLPRVYSYYNNLHTISSPNVKFLLCFHGLIHYSCFIVFFNWFRQISLTQGSTPAFLHWGSKFIIQITVSWQSFFFLYVIYLLFISYLFSSIFFAYIFMRFIYIF